MTTDRIERAARLQARRCELPESEWPAFVDEVEGILLAAIPELFAEPPSHWLAPWTLPPTNAPEGNHAEWLPAAWRMIRDAHLKEQAE